MSEVKLAAELRSEFGKGAARRIRRAHKVPAVLYGHGTDPVHVSLPGHETMLALKASNALLNLDFGDRSELALVKDIQRDPVKQIIEHVDLLIVRRGEKVAVDVAVHTVGEPAPGTLVTVEHNTISLEVEATNIPQFVEVDIDGAEAGTQVTAGTVTLPAGTVLLTDADAIVVHVAEPQAVDLGEEDEAAEGEAAEGEAAEEPVAEGADA